MRSPSFKGVTIITTPSEEKLNYVLNLRVQDFIYKLIEDGFLEKGAPVYLTFSPNNVQLYLNKSIVNVKYVAIPNANGGGGGESDYIHSSDDEDVAPNATATDN